MLSYVHLMVAVAIIKAQKRIYLYICVPYTHRRHVSFESGSTFCSQCRQLPDCSLLPSAPPRPPLLPCLSRKVIDEKPFPYFSLADSTRLFSTDVPCEDSSLRDGFLFKPSNEASMRWRLCWADCRHCSGPDQSLTVVWVSEDWSSQPV
ncbi:hypothetical protein ROHU_024396 [Labeo rohita]|uniref:Uncharacterized protein n=1 Tax=Labeo rohita TaxID=84645 RepID=A0A498MIT0_LABRO|nr:hypothetical protein ROHU_024396 [Labeo rohita]